MKRTKVQLALHDPSGLLGWDLQRKVVLNLRQGGVGYASYDNWLDDHIGGVYQIDHCPHGMFQKSAAMEMLPLELLEGLSVRNP